MRAAERVLAWPSTTTPTRSRRPGSSRPGDSWTYDEFTAAAEKLTGEGRHGVGIDLSTIRAAPWVWAAGGELVDDPVNPTKFLFDTPEGRRGLEHVIALRENGWAPSADEADAKGVDERFLDGSVAMFLSSRRDVPVLRTITDFEWDVAPFPTDVEPASVLHSDGFCISKGDNADAAWQWVEYALGEQGQEVLAASGRSVPSLQGRRRVAGVPRPDRPAGQLEGVRRRAEPDAPAAGDGELERGRGRSPTTSSRSSTTAGSSSTRAGAARRGDRRQILSAALDVEGVSRRYGGVEALRELSLAVAPGELVAVLGASGSGKSTLLRAIAGLEPPDGGRVLIDGDDQARRRARRGAAWRWSSRASRCSRT